MNQADAGLTVSAAHRGNLCIAELSISATRRLLAKAESVLLKQEALLMPVGDANWIYFLDDGIASVTKRDRSGCVLESGMIGREGLIGGQQLFGLPAIECEVRMIVEGVARRIEVGALQEVLGKGELARAHGRFIYALYEQTCQNVLCNRHHELESRLARWLLQVSDFTHSPVLLFKHALLAELLGVTRSAVTIAAGHLLDEGLIRYSRGEILILERKRLRGVACECYQSIFKLYKAIYPTLF